MYLVLNVKFEIIFIMVYKQFIVFYFNYSLFGEKLRENGLNKKMIKYE